MSTYMVTPNLFFGTGAVLDHIAMHDIDNAEDASTLLLFGATVRVPDAETAVATMACMGMGAEEIQERMARAYGTAAWDGVALNEA